MTNTNIERAARAIAAAVVHGTTGDPALEAAQQLDELGLLTRSTDPFSTPGKNRPAPSPAAVAALAECGKAKRIADTARAQIDGMPGTPDVSSVGGEVRFVVHPRSLADWKQWMHALGVGDSRADSTGVSMTVRCTYGGVRARLVGVGVPALYGEQLADLGRRMAVRP
ncbi:hypothetical protein OHA98_41770 [Streptomyces sp. NBC_00654]|uniref:hypothetical protein n=1 Tax=Streptomyces sp. NBC_00654 TaxID=2975799 RepID=UPI00224CCA26|nr:hypothetical protein [Streptomyces sp. NBC_00654]MCX4969357.1 hypothetical protein [Streptomyces sp. NBC_00654]MCX4971136.1 hypothetical protein [Streptomyces sp. NBC_00654]